MGVNGWTHPEGIFICYDVTQKNDRRKEKLVPRIILFNIWERVDQLPFHLTAAGHLAPCKSQKQWYPGLLRRACGFSISLWWKDKPKRLFYLSFPFSNHIPWRKSMMCSFLSESNMMGLDLAGSYHSNWSLFQRFWKDMQVQCSTGISLIHYGRPSGRKECLYLQCQWLEWGSSPSFSITMT